MQRNNHHQNLKVNDDRGRAHTVQEGRAISRSRKRNARQSSLRSLMMLSSIDDECDQSQRKEGSANIDRLSISAKFTAGEYDQPLLRPLRQQSLKSLWGDLSQKSQESCDEIGLDGSDRFSVASAKFGLPEEENLPIYCPMRQISHNMNCSLNEISAFGDWGSSDIEDICASYRSNGINESIDSISSELLLMS